MAVLRALFYAHLFDILDVKITEFVVLWLVRWDRRERGISPSGAAFVILFKIRFIYGGILCI